MLLHLSLGRPFESDTFRLARGCLKIDIPKNRSLKMESYNNKPKVSARP